MLALPRLVLTFKEISVIYITVVVAECEKFGSAKHFTLNLIETVLLLLDMVPLKCESWVDKPIHVGNYKQTFAAEYSF